MRLVDWYERVKDSQAQFQPHWDAMTYDQMFPELVKYWERFWLSLLHSCLYWYGRLWVYVPVCRSCLKYSDFYYFGAWGETLWTHHIQKMLHGMNGPDPSERLCVRFSSTMNKPCVQFCHGMFPLYFEVWFISLCICTCIYSSRQNIIFIKRFYTT